MGQALKQLRSLEKWEKKKRKTPTHCRLAINFIIIISNPYKVIPSHWLLVAFLFSPFSTNTQDLLTQHLL